MKHRTRIYFSAEQRADIWDRWQRGSNENTNRLLMQYLPKGIDLSRYTQAQLNNIPQQLNERSRKKHDTTKHLPRNFRHVLLRPVELTADNGRFRGCHFGHTHVPY